MRNHNHFILATIITGIAFFVLPSTHAMAVTLSDGDSCATAGSLHQQNDTDGVTYLVCNGSTWEENVYIDKDELVGIGNSAPKAKLHVEGEIILGNTSASCIPDIEGAIRYNSTDKNIEICDGTSWSQIQASSCDNAPAFLSFSSLTSQTTSTLVTSDILQVTGMDSGCSTSVGVSGDGSPEYRTCSDSSCVTEIQTWTSSNLTLDIQGNYIQLRTTTSASTETSTNVTLNTGPTSQIWNVTTGLTDCAPIGSVCEDGTIYAGLSQGSIPMFVTRCDAGQTWGGSSCDGSAIAISWNDGSSNYTETSVTGTADGQTNTASLITIDSNSVNSGTQEHSAAQYCADLVLHGHSDWYLPAMDELDTIRANRSSIGTLSATYYWSSSEYNSDNAWMRDLDSSTSSTYAKRSTRAVRCARR